AARRFHVVRVVERLRNQVPLQGHAIGGGPVKGKGLVVAPAHRAVVDDEVAAVQAAKGIVAAAPQHGVAIGIQHLLVLIAQTKAQKAHHY
nr:hypothetical protein [Tanacetum cinerariifolium]